MIVSSVMPVWFLKPLHEAALRTTGRRVVAAALGSISPASAARGRGAAATGGRGVSTAARAAGRSRDRAVGDTRRTAARGGRTVWPDPEPLTWATVCGSSWEPQPARTSTSTAQAGTSRLRGIWSTRPSTGD